MATSGSRVAFWLAGQAGKVLVRKLTGPRVGAPLEKIIDYATERAGMSTKAGKDGEYNYRPLTDEESKAYWEALARRDYGVYLVVGEIGSGKSAVCALIAQLAQDYKEKPSIWRGPSQAALDTLKLDARAVSRETLVELMGEGGLYNTCVVIEDGTRDFDAWSSGTGDAAVFREFMAVRCRKQGNILCVNTQSAAILLKHVLPTAIMAKRPHMAARDEERGGQYKRSQRAERAFNLLRNPKEEVKHVWVEDPAARMQRLVPVPLIPTWSDTFSKAA